MERKYMNSDKAPMKRVELTTLINEVGGGTNIQGKRAYVLQYKSYKPECRSLHWHLLLLSEL